jgi:hypothetical protein
MIALALMARPVVVAPVELFPVGGDEPEGRPAGVRPGSNRRLAVEAAREVEGARVGIEEDLVRVEPMRRKASPIDLIRVEAGAVHLSRRDAEVPHRA